MAVRAQPRARRSSVGPVEGGRLKIAVPEKPERGKANGAIARLLARTLGVAASNVELLRGTSSRDKVFLVHGIDLDQARAALRKHKIEL